MPSIAAIDSSNGPLSQPDVLNGVNMTRPFIPTGVYFSDHPGGQASSGNVHSQDMPHSPCPPIAIVGMAMRLPGGVRTEDQFWQFLLDKKDGICEVPGTRYNIDAFYSNSKPNSIKTRHGYFLQEDLRHFDSSFFSFSNQEASRADPQQRLLLEVVWECMENAGQTDWRGKDIGCYVGVYGEDWLDLSLKDAHIIDRGHIAGTGDFVLSNGVSYRFDLKGPSMTLKTGCSSTLVGLHEACQALYSGDCSSAIVAGTNLIFTPTMTTTMCDNGVLSPDGVCKTFDANADGYGRGEAVNALYIKPLRDAYRDGDPIRAVIRSTSTNADGRTMKIAAPKSETQEQLILRTYEKAGIRDVSETAFFECHGTGTDVGDVVETSAVAAIFNRKGIHIGAVKPNFGHSEGASGLTSIIKAVLALEHRLIPPNVHFQTPNPRIPFKEAKLAIPLDVTPWPEDRKERVSVNSFGIGGSNAHVILDSATSFCVNSDRQILQPDKKPQLLLLSAASMTSLQKRVNDLKDYMDRKSPDMQALAYTLAARRDHLSCRTFVIAENKTELDTSQLQLQRSASPTVTFVFTGQGGQWAGMGRGLLEMYGSFVNDIDSMDRVLQSLPEPPKWRLKDELCSVEELSRINDAEFSQPLGTAIQIGLVNLLLSYGIRPASVVGHSCGEIAAAYAAGVFDMATAIIIAYYRGKVVKSAKEGSMAAIGLNAQDIQPFLEEGVVAACQNSPKSTTISGDVDKIERMLERIRAEQPDTFCRRLKVNVAYHSEHMRELGQPYEDFIKPHIQLNRRMLPMYSSVTGKVITDPFELNASYWQRNLLSPVLFSTAVERIFADQQKNSLLVEVGPHSVLSGPIRQIIQSTVADKKPIYMETLVRGKDQARCLLAAVGNAYSYGIPIDLKTISPATKVLHDLPTYPWDHGVEHWNETRVAHGWRFRRFPHHELLGSRTADSSDIEPAWKNHLRVEAAPWLSDHVLLNDVLFPAAGYIAMAGEAIRQITDCDDFTIRDLSLRAPFYLRETESVEVITSLKPLRLANSVDSEWYDFTVVAHDGNDWKKYCHGRVCAGSEDKFEHKCFTPFPRKVSSESWYRVIATHGLQYGPRFRQLQQITADPTSKTATAVVHDAVESHGSKYLLHPIVIDQALQLTAVAESHGISRRIEKLGIPSAFEKIYVGTGSGQIGMRVSSGPHSGNLLSADATATVGDRVVLSISHGFFFARSNREDGANRIPLLSRLAWKPDLSLMPFSQLLSFNPAGRCSTWLKDVTQLCIMESAFQVEILVPTSATLRKYAGWLQKSAALIREDPQHIEEGSPVRRQRIKRLMSLTEGDTSLASLMWAVMDNIGAIMQGDITPLEVLSQNAGLQNLYDYFASPRTWEKFFSLLVHSNPRLKVLEIGGGTGGTTAMMLNSLRVEDGLPAYASYTFSDILPSLLKAAGERFKEHKNVLYTALDISKDPLEQGYDKDGYDVIIASNVLHATPDIQQALKHVRQLLAPGGYLLIQELDLEIPVMDFILGILPDWWNQRNDDRPEKPYVATSRWDQELRQAGFTGVETKYFDDYRPCQIVTNILTRKPLQVKSSKEVTLVYRSKVLHWARTIEEQLLLHGYVVNWTRFVDAAPTVGDVIFLPDLEGPFLHDISERDFERLKRCFFDWKDSHMLWITPSTLAGCEDPRYGLTHGFARTMRKEMALNLATLEVDLFSNDSAIALVQVLQKFQATDFDSPSPEFEFAVHDGIVHIPRFLWESQPKHTASPLTDDLPRKLFMRHTGAVDTLDWAPVKLSPLGKNEVEVEVKYVGLNFKDIMIGMGLFGHTEDMGIEGSGIVRRVGSEVTHIQVDDTVVFMGAGFFQTRIIIPATHCIKSPLNITLEKAATLPVVFSTAVYSLMYLASLRTGQSILIHSACGGVGIAAIQISQMIGAEIYATVGSEEKACHLVEKYGLPRHRIFDSRSTSFLPDLMKETDGKGVDVVLNSLAGELLHASWRCVARGGKMIELGKRDFLDHGMLSMDRFAENRAFFGVDISALGEEDAREVERIMMQVSDWLCEGVLQPIEPIHTFPAEKIAEAFQYMQKGVHMGKIVIEMPESPVKLLGSTSRAPLSLSSDAAYLLVGGLGGIGQAVATWMVEKGARHLVFLSRSAGQLDQHRDFVQELETQGCKVILVTGSVTALSDVEEAISCSTKPIAGVIQMAMVLSDRGFSEMTYEGWNMPLGPKVTGTWNLHLALRNSPLDFFTVFSSVSGLCGNSGQANYAAASTFLDSFVQYRRHQGLPASVLDLGVFGEIGCLAQDPKLLSVLRANSVRLLEEKQLMEALELAICQQKQQQPVADSSSGDLASPVLAVGMGSTKPHSNPDVTPPWPRDARFGAYYIHDSQDDGANHNVDGGDGSRGSSLIAEVENNRYVLHEPGIERRVTREMGLLISSSTGRGGKDMSDEDMANMAIDSLMSIEIRNWIRRKMSIEISMAELSKAGTVGNLGKLVTEKLRAKYFPEGTDIAA